MPKVTIFTDGACSGNPGPGGYGAVLLYTDTSGTLHRRELSAGYARTTNNRMELMGVIAALEALRMPCEVELYSDSKYVIDALTKGWAEKWQRFGWYKDAKRSEKAKNPDLWQKLLELASQHTMTYHWVKGHAQTQENNRCDELAVKAGADRAHWLSDSQYADEKIS